MAAQGPFRKFFAPLRAPFEVVKRVRFRAAPLTMAGLTVFTFYKVYAYDTKRINIQLEAEKAKTKGPAYFANILKTEGEWKVFIVVN